MFVMICQGTTDKVAVATIWYIAPNGEMYVYMVPFK